MSIVDWIYGCIPFNARYAITAITRWGDFHRRVHSRVVEGLLGDCPAPRDTWRTEDGDLNTGKV